MLTPHPWHFADLALQNDMANSIKSACRLVAACAACFGAVSSGYLPSSAAGSTAGRARNPPSLWTMMLLRHSISASRAFTRLASSLDEPKAGTCTQCPVRTSFAGSGFIFLTHQLPRLRCRAKSSGRVLDFASYDTHTQLPKASPVSGRQASEQLPPEAISAPFPKVETELFGAYVHCPCARPSEDLDPPGKTEKYSSQAKHHEHSPGLRFVRPRISWLSRVNQSCNTAGVCGRAPSCLLAAESF